MRGIRMLVAAALIAGGAAGCAGNAASSGMGSDQPAANAVTVSVQNDYMLAMDIYAVTAEHSMRLGSVGPGMHDTLVLDPGFMPNGFVEIIARPPGGGRVVNSGQLNPAAGQTIEFVIDANLVGSTATIR